MKVHVFVVLLTSMQLAEKRLDVGSPKKTKENRNWKKAGVDRSGGGAYYCCSREVIRYFLAFPMKAK